MTFLRNQFQCTGRNRRFQPVVKVERREEWFAVASLLSHAVAALGVGACLYNPGIPKRVWVIGVACSVIPDFDVIGFRFGIHYGDFWGHRGFTHSLVFATILASAIVLLVFRDGLPNISPLSSIQDCPLRKAAGDASRKAVLGRSP
jgi:hypothetical protein